MNLMVKKGKVAIQKCEAKTTEPTGTGGGPGSGPGNGGGSGMGSGPGSGIGGGMGGMGTRCACVSMGGGPMPPTGSGSRIKPRPLSADEIVDFHHAPTKTVHCCRNGSIHFVTTCGDGVSCFNICGYGEDHENNHHVMTTSANSARKDWCGAITGHDPTHCHPLSQAANRCGKGTVFIENCVAPTDCTGNYTQAKADAGCCCIYNWRCHNSDTKNWCPNSTDC